MAVGLRKFALLLWKNYVLQKRHKIQTVMEVLVPVLFTLVLVLIRGTISSHTYEEPVRFRPFTVDDETHTSVTGGCYLLYAPNNPLVHQIMNNDIMRTYFPRTAGNYTVIGYESENELLNAYQNPQFMPCKNVTEVGNANPVLAAVLFQTADGTNQWTQIDDVKFVIRFPATHHVRSTGELGQGFQWRTSLLYPLFQIPGPRASPANMSDPDTCVNDAYQSACRGGSPHYWAEGFLYLQNAIEEALLSMMSSGTTSDEQIQLQRYPYPPFIDDIFLTALQGYLPLIIVFSFIYSVINITKSITVEKEKRLKEYMKMMGLPNWLHWTAWFLKSYVFILISIIFMVILLNIKLYDGGNLAVLTHSDWSLFFVFLLNYAISMITMAFFVSTLFSKANSSATGAGVVFFLTYIPFTFLQQRYDTLSKFTKIFTSLFSNTALSYGCTIISMWEGTGRGARWSNIAQVASPDDNWTFLDVNIMLFVDGILYLLLAIYIEGVFPGEYGLPMPWYFPFTGWYWTGKPRVDEEAGFATEIDSQLKSPKNFEKEPNGRAGIQIKGLTKVFGEKIAVNNLSINMYDGQITALLGHNGAGKTTTMSMVTGLIPPSAGTAIVDGFDIRHDITSVRQNLGLCPQHDVLFDEMTVLEHLRFYARMKGCPNELLDGEVDRMLKAINLEPKKDTQASSLSGGMKRRLSIGIAFIGGSRVVLLDEPSSGLDPGARRQIWDLIQSEKKDCTIVLSTHFMDEADLLGDRIVVLANGNAQCCGSSLFLKKRYGGGYHLIIVKKAECDVDRITEFLRLQIPNVEIDQNIGSELTYSLPDDLSHLFGDMFEELEQRKNEFGIASYGASITTMEEVFIRVGREAEGHAEAQQNGHSVVPLENTNKINKLYQKLDRNSGFDLLKQQLWAMIVKKFLYAIRSKVLLAVQTIIPIGFLIITLIMLQTLPTGSEQPEMDFTLEKYTTYGTTYTTVNCGSGNSVCGEFQNLVNAYSDIVNSDNVSETIIQKAIDDLPQVNYGYIVALEEGSNASLTGFFNNQPFHTPPLVLNLIHQALLRSSTGSNKTISVSNWPLPRTPLEDAQNVGSMGSDGFQIGFSISFGMSFLAASFVVFHIKEQETNAKHLQVVSGVKPSTFWTSAFLFDAINYLIPCFGLMIVLLAFQSADFKSAEMQGYVFVLFLFYGWSVIPFMYLTSFWFTVPSSGFTVTSMFNIFTGLATVLAISILQLEELGLTHIADVLQWIFMLFPNFNLGYGFMQLSSNRQLHSVCPAVLNMGICVVNPEHTCCINYPKGYLSWSNPGIGANILFMALIGFACFVWIFVKETELLRRIRFGGQKSSIMNNKNDDMLDTDVEAENARIRETNHTQLLKTDNLILTNLTKIYGEFKAVDQLCLGVQKGECFGLLGINGAGKSSTFKMLTGDIDITSGDAFVYGKSVKSEIKKVQQEVGYCPQFDALIPELTGRETIRLFARLRGVKENEIDDLADALAAKLLFTEHMEKPCGTYSGGNKRKLSTAIALVGNPPMVLLDEPTTGMDPVARRHLWDSIIDVRDAGTSIVLTSHSMDECEALCTRLAVMVNGAFRCLGSTQHLKNKFGEGYTLIAQIETAPAPEEGRVTRQALETARRRSSSIKTMKEKAQHLQAWEEELQPFREYIERTFPGCELKDVHAGYVHYHIRNTHMSWGYMFKKMEEAKRIFKIEAYSVGQTTLEQVFLGFTKSQINADEQ